MNQDHEVINDGYLIVSGSRIEEVGKTPFAGDRSEFTATVNLKANVLLPGLVNTHGHAAMTLLRGYADDLPLSEWLEARIWPIEDLMTAEDIKWGTWLAIWEMIASGTTTFTDMYFHEDQVAQAVEDSGMRAVLSRGMIGFAPKGEQTAMESRDFVQRWNGAAGGRITTLLGPHAAYTCPPEYLREIVVPLAQELNVPLQIHLCETRYEVEQSIAQYGVTPVQHLVNCGVFAVPTLAAHCVHVSDHDIDLLKANGVRIAHNPQSNLKLGSGIAPLSKLRSAGLTIGLGTDGAASNNDLDMWEEIRLAATLHKGTAEDPVLVSACEALELGTAGGAQALFLEQGLGTLVPGAPADFIVVDYHKPYYYPRHDVTAHLVYSAKSADVIDVVVDGRQLMRNGEYLTLDVEQIVYETNRCASRLFGS
ncbi:MAG: N-ethylammeline chlorohydrolase [Bacilli bacterium]|nr:N-ethylammeline chlorohydrolase [Bacilli bacterium]